MNAAERERAPVEQDQSSHRTATRRPREVLNALAEPETLLVINIVLLALSIRLFRLNDIPAEMWGDVITHYQLAQQVMAGHLYFDYEFGGDGPMLSYLAAGMAAIFGLSFTTLKLVTVVAGTGVVAVTYFLARELFNNRHIGLLSALITAISFWDITFSRQAKPYILVPLFATGAVVLVLQKRPLPAGAVLGLGMYTQAAFWGTPLAFIASPTALIVAAVWALPVLISFVRDPSMLIGSSSYIGEKLHAHLSLWGMTLRVLDNVRKNALAFNVQGDTVFRHNIPGHPHLDAVTGAFFIVGMALIVLRIVRERDKRLLLWFLSPFLVIQIPSVLDMHPLNVPAMGRTVGVTPFACTAAGYALYTLWQRLQEALRTYLAPARVVASAVLGCILLTIFAINAYNYFVVYPRTLPNANTPFGATIAEQISRSSPTTYSILVGCCWGEWGQPEPDAVLYRVEGAHLVLSAEPKSNLAHVIHTSVPPGVRVELYTSPLDSQLAARHVPGLVMRRSHILRRRGWDVARVIEAVRSP